MIDIKKIFNHSIRKPNIEGMSLLGFEKIPSANEYHEKLLKVLLENDTLENCLKAFSKEFSKTEQFNIFIKYILEKYDFEGIYKKIKSNEFWVLSAFLRDELNFCLECGKPTLRKYCSSKCSNSSEEVKKLKEKTLKENFGVTNPMFSNAIKTRVKQTNLKRYGVECSFENEKVKEKIKTTNLEKYGFESASKSDIVKDRIKQSHIEKYGKEWFTQTDLFLEKCKRTNLEKYGVDNVSKSEKVKEKIKKSLFSQHDHKNYKDFNEEFIKENFIENKKFKVKEFMEHFNFFNRNSMNKIKRFLNIIEPNNDWNFCGKSKAELELFEWIPLENKISGDRSLIAPYEIDILLPDLKLAIEYNGSYWHSFYPLSYHLNKLNMCNEKGFELWFIYDFDDMEFWKRRLLDRINNSKRKFDLKGLIDKRLYNKEELKHPIIQNIDPTEDYILGRFVC